MTLRLLVRLTTLPWHISTFWNSDILALLLWDAFAFLAVIVRWLALLSVMHSAMHLLLIVTLLFVNGVALLRYFIFTFISEKKFKRNYARNTFIRTFR